MGNVGKNSPRAKRWESSLGFEQMFVSLKGRNRFLRLLGMILHSRHARVDLLREKEEEASPPHVDGTCEGRERGRVVQ